MNLVWFDQSSHYLQKGFDSTHCEYFREQIIGLIIGLCTGPKHAEESDWGNDERLSHEFRSEARLCSCAIRVSGDPMAALGAARNKAQALDLGVSWTKIQESEELQQVLALDIVVQWADP